MTEAPEAEPSDDFLMRRIRQGDSAAFQHLYERHSRPVFTFLLRFVGDRERAEDLLQETFYRVYLARKRYHTAGSFRSWLFTIARRLALNAVASHARGAAKEDTLDPLVPYTDHAPSPLARLEGLADVESLFRALETLPPQYREVILLARVSSLDLREVAQVLGTSHGATRVLLHRALKALRARLDLPP